MEALLSEALIRGSWLGASPGAFSREPHRTENRSKGLLQFAHHTSSCCNQEAEGFVSGTLTQLRNNRRLGR